MGQGRIAPLMAALPIRRTGRERRYFGANATHEQIQHSHNQAESHMNADQILGQVRPLLHLAGSIIIAAGLLDFASVVNIPGNGLETAVAGFLVKHI